MLISPINPNGPDRPPPLSALPHAALALPDPLAQRRDRALMCCVALAHGLALWALMQLDTVRRVLVEVAPLMVALVAAPVVDQPLQPPRLAPSARPAPVWLQPVPQVALPAAPAPQAISVDAVAAPALTATPAPAAVAATAAPLAPPAPAAPPPPRKVVDARAVRYLLEPPVEVPRASRRAGEHGVVWLRVVVGVQGAPLHVSVWRSSGFSRLDEQALWAMRQARFKPHTEDGRAVEVEVTAPIEYPPD